MIYGVVAATGAVDVKWAAVVVHQSFTAVSTISFT